MIESLLIIVCVLLSPFFLWAWVYAISAGWYMGIGVACRTSMKNNEESSVNVDEEVSL
jgi:hypothetical protein